MNELDAMRKLAEANPVREQDLTPLATPDRFARRPPNRRLGLAIAIAAVAAAALGVTLAFSGSSSGHRESQHASGPQAGFGKFAGPVGPTGAHGAPGVQPISVSFNRTGSTLSSIDVTVDPWVDVPGDHARIQLQVRHRAPDSTAYTIVYRTEVSPNTIPSVPPVAPSGPTGGVAPGASDPLPVWSGTLSPSDWSGGCQSGLYWISVRFILPAPYSAADFSGPAEDEFMGSASSKPFDCSGRLSGDVGPTGQSAPQGTSAGAVYNHNGNTLTSVDVTATETEKGGFEIEVFHRAAGDSNGNVVYRQSVSADDMSSGEWSGTLYPSDWDGGCESGVYWIVMRFDLYPLFNADTRSASRFTCR